LRRGVEGQRRRVSISQYALRSPGELKLFFCPGLLSTFKVADGAKQIPKANGLTE